MNLQVLLRTRLAETLKNISKKKTLSRLISFRRSKILFEQALVLTKQNLKSCKGQINVLSMKKASSALLYTANPG